MSDRRFYEDDAAGPRRTAPAALRNREPIADVLRDWLPPGGVVLEVASGSGEHAVHFARAFPHLEWQPSDQDPGSLASIAAWREEAALPNLRSPIALDASAPDWPVKRADAVIAFNLVHIAPWSAALGLIAGAARLLAPGAPFTLYGPWLEKDVEPAPGNLAFDADLRRLDSAWGLRMVEDFAASARRQFSLAERRPMPANNLMLSFWRVD